ncbi:MAG: hypothetical protein IJE17_09035, partial [Clostridia bacterium]|nr:hypothetical protein [Clostridia bacterium]
NDGIVVNILSLRKSQESEFPDCVPLNDIPAGIGDTYSDGLFYRDGVELKSVSQQLAEANEILNIILEGE